MSKKLYVGNLPFSSTEDDLKSLFSNHGSVSFSRVITDRETGRSRGFGFIEMNTDAEAASAMSALNGYSFDGRNLVVKEAMEKEDRTQSFRPQQNSRRPSNSPRTGNYR